MVHAPLFSLLSARIGSPSLLFFFETDCPTCRLATPYLNRLHEAAGGPVIGVSQDGDAETARFVEQLGVRFPVYVDRGWEVSRAYNPQTAPTLYLVGTSGGIEATLEGFDKGELNSLAAKLGYKAQRLAGEFDGAPSSKPGCMSRHLEPQAAVPAAGPIDIAPERGKRASHILLEDAQDPYEYCMRAFGDPLPVVPPTPERVDRMLRATSLGPEQVIGLVPPCYGAATVEKIAANAVMAGCEPPMMRVLIPLIRAACDERFNLHGIQATTHFATPLILVNGPVRRELGFACAGNVFSNVTRANSTLGRAFQLILTNLGGARPGQIDMSTLGHPGKFSYCIAENEEASPWEPYRAGSAITLFAADPPRGVSEHTARSGKVLLKAICATLATVWSWRVCMTPEAFVILCPEHAETLRRDRFSKRDVRDFLFENTGVPLGAYEEEDGGEGTQPRSTYEEVTIGGERNYRKFRAPESIHIVVAGGTAGKFSAVIGSWATGPRGSQVVTYPIE
ncbi:MAG: TlpA family protein disulfide reductase [Acidobacteria bacterium]|nr:TlpA family protein disulfide reductase [Acidobacteriota bacterium]